MGKMQPPAPPAEGHYQVAAKAVIYQGPIPPPEILAKFDDVVPGAAERILRMAEKEQDMNAEDKRGSRFIRLVSLCMAFAICIGTTACGVALALNGHEAIGVAMVGTQLLGLVSAFLKSSKAK